MEGSASVRVIDHGFEVSVVDLEIPEDCPRGTAIRLGSEVMRFAAGRPVWIAVEISNHSAYEFFEAAGFRQVSKGERNGKQFNVMVKNYG